MITTLIYISIIVSMLTSETNNILVSLSSLICLSTSHNYYITIVNVVQGMREKIIKHKLEIKVINKFFNECLQFNFTFKFTIRCKKNCWLVSFSTTKKSFIIYRNKIFKDKKNMFENFEINQLSVGSAID